MKHIVPKIFAFILRILRKIFKRKVHLDVDQDGKEDITIHLDE